MALTNKQRKKIFTRLLVKLGTGEMDEQEQIAFRNALLTAVGNKLDTQLAAEATKWRAELQATKANLQVESTKLDTDIASI